MGPRRGWLLALLMVVGCAEGVGQSPDAQSADAMASVIDAAPVDAVAADACVALAAESCDGTDEDCDGEIDEDFELGVACDSDDEDLCLDDVVVCSEDGTETVCGDMGPALVELCNGLDDDCRADTEDGSGEGGLGMPCDGDDSDLCLEGTLLCAGGLLQCSDVSGSSADLCNGLDDDCDPSSADGSEDGQVGALCDGPDGDLCNEGTTQCSGGAIVCTDLTTTSLDLCNGFDDDCDPASADGSEDPQVGIGCDGPDGDLCIEGISSCQSGALACSDTSTTTLDLCNGLDDDCDPLSADGSEDSLVGVACDGGDTDSCKEGATQCVAAQVQCSDTSGDNLELCNGLDDDCNGQVDEGFPRDTNPLCSAATLLGSVSGDLGPQTLTATGGTEQWYRVRITENSFTTSSYLSATVELSSPPNMDFDLFVYCEACGGALSGSSNLGTGLVDTVNIRRNDGPQDESFDVFIEVRFFGATACNNWNLSVRSDTAVASPTCGL